MNKASHTTRALLGVSWAGGSPSVRVRDDSALVSTEVALAELDLNYRVDEHSERLCLGHVPFRKGRDAYVDCVNQPRDGDRKCNRCAANDATFASNLHHAHTLDPDSLDSSVARHMLQPNVGYLAAFRDGSIKIGTSTAKRQQERLTEQGAWVARIVASSTDGLAIRVLEDTVTKRLGLAQSVSARRKVAGLANPASDDMLESRLSDLSVAVAEIISDLNDDRLTVADDRWESGAIGNQVWDHVHLYGQSLTTGSHQLTVKAVSGRQIAFTRSGGEDVFVADLGPLMGVQLELGNFQPAPIAVQDALF